MRKIITLLLIALLALSGVALAESTPVAAGINGADAVRTATDLYFAIPSDGRQMLIRLPLAGGDPVCLDRGDFIADLISDGDGVVYLKTTSGASAIARAAGNQTETLYNFGEQAVSRLSYADGRFMVLIDGALHSVDPTAQLCLKLSGAQMLDYVIGAGSAYFLSAGDRLEYTAQLEGGESVRAQAGCVYSLDLSNGETTLLLKSGGQDLKLAGDELYFHNLADAYAVRTAEETELLGRVYGLNVQRKDLEQQSAEPDSGFWPTDRGLVVWHSGALNLNSEAGNISLYQPENGATVVSDGAMLYVWEPSRQSLTQLSTAGEQQTVYSGDLTQAQDASLIVTATAEPSPSASPASDQGDAGNSAWFDQFLENRDLVESGSSSGIRPAATPIGVTPTPRPTATPAPNGVSGGNAGGSGNSSSGGASGNSSSSGSSSSSGTTAGGSYSTSIEYLKITGNSVNIRSRAGTNYRVVGSVKGGSIVECLGLAAKDSNGTVWYKIEHNGVTGWVTSQYAKKSSAPDDNYVGPEVSVGGDYVRVVDGNVTVRKAPNLNGAKLGTLSKGTTVDFLNKSSTDARGVKWYKISYEGKTGWVSSRYSEITYGSSGGSSSTGKYVRATGGSVTIRSSASKSGSVLGYLSEGATGTYLGKSSTDERGVRWYKLEYKGVTGWVSSRYSTLTNTASSGGSSSGGSSSSTSGSKVKVVGGDVTIRASANKSSDKLGFIAEGNTAAYLGKSSTDSRGVKWYKIKYDGVTGWISSRYSKIV